MAGSIHFTAPDANITEGRLRLFLYASKSRPQRFFPYIQDLGQRLVEAALGKGRGYYSGRGPEESRGYFWELSMVLNNPVI